MPKTKQLTPQLNVNNVLVENLPLVRCEELLAGLDGGVENRTGKLVKVSQIPGVRPGQSQAR